MSRFPSTVSLLMILFVAAPVRIQGSNQQHQCFKVPEEYGPSLDESSSLCVDTIQTSHCHAVLDGVACQSCTSTYPHSCKDPSKLYTKDTGFHMDCSNVASYLSEQLLVCDGVVTRREPRTSQQGAAHSQIFGFVGAWLLAIGLFARFGRERVNGWTKHYFNRPRMNDSNNNNYDPINVESALEVELASGFEPPTCFVAKQETST